jgi:hypothetical protein
MKEIDFVIINIVCLSFFSEIILLSIKLTLLWFCTLFFMSSDCDGSENFAADFAQVEQNLMAGVGEC